MRSFESLYQQATRRKGGEAALEALLPAPLSTKELANIPGDRWLAMMSKCIFNAGFNWKVVDKKWPNFETVFAGFNPTRWKLSTFKNFS